MKTDTYDKLMRKARKHIAGMDAIDGSNVTTCDLDQSLRTIMCALNAAMRERDKWPDTAWSAVADAQVMLSQLERKHRSPGVGDGDYYLKEK